MNPITLDKLVQSFEVELLTLITAIVIQSARVDRSGQLVKSLSVSIQPDKISISLSDWAKYVDAGRKIGQRPPYTVILNWVKQKSIQFGKLSKESIAYLIMQSIYKRGIKPRPFIDQLVKSIILSGDKLITNFLDQEITNSINSLFS